MDAQGYSQAVLTGMRTLILICLLVGLSVGCCVGSVGFFVWSKYTEVKEKELKD